MRATMAETANLPDEAQGVLRFWFEELEEEQWWLGDASPEVDATIRERFSELHMALCERVPEEWLATPLGTLAAIIVLDQFSRNLFRNEPRAYDADAKALELAKWAVEKGFDRQVGPEERIFFCIPFSHSEQPEDQVLSVELCTVLGNEKTLHYAKLHKQIIDRFGRFPHRNRILGRQSTRQEEEFLKDPGLFW